MHLDRGNKRLPSHRKDAEIALSCRRLPLSTRARSLDERRETNSLSPDGWRNLGWTNLMDQPQHNNTDFSITKYSLKKSDNGNYRCSKIRRGSENLLSTSTEFNTPRETLSVTNIVEHNLQLHLALKDQRENSFDVQEIPLLLGS